MIMLMMVEWMFESPFHKKLPPFYYYFLFLLQIEEETYSKKLRKQKTKKLCHLVFLYKSVQVNNEKNIVDFKRYITFWSSYIKMVTDRKNPQIVFSHSVCEDIIEIVAFSEQKENKINKKLHAY